ncbi:MAG: sulfite exporter TauE/SafE family protein [Chloroflexi bacterium]|nr:sulfite exporter TauE/SafE family protein [Chloroflexota bacterium]
MDTVADLLLIGVIAAFAQTVNQAMGMGYGVISSSLLLSTGMPPAVISATVHAAEVGTSTTGGLAHWRLGNVDRRVVLGLALPGVIGGFAGALLLTSIPASTARPMVGGILLALGILVLLRFANPRRALVVARWSKRALAPLGATAGLMDATGGGGWGPVTMGTLMSRPPAEPRIVIGTVNVAEAFVTIAITAGFLVGGGLGGFQIPEMLALMAGGMVVSVPAAVLARRLPTNVLGIAIGILLITLNVRTIAVAVGADGITVLALMAFAAGVAGLLATGIRLANPGPHLTATEGHRSAVLVSREESAGD